jgi:hypothetical protein
MLCIHRFNVCYFLSSSITNGQFNIIFLFKNSHLTHIFKPLTLMVMFSQSTLLIIRSLQMIKFSKGDTFSYNSLHFYFYMIYIFADLMLVECSCSVDNFVASTKIHVTFIIPIHYPPHYRIILI